MGYQALQEKSVDQQIKEKIASLHNVSKTKYKLAILSDLERLTYRDDENTSFESYKLIHDSVVGKLAQETGPYIRKALVDVLNRVAIHSSDKDLKTSAIINMVKAAEQTTDDAARDDIYTACGSIVFQAGYEDYGLSDENWAGIAQSIFTTLNPNDAEQQGHCHLLHEFRNNIDREFDDMLDYTPDAEAKDVIIAKLAQYRDVQFDVVTKDTPQKEIETQQYNTQIVANLLKFL